MADRLRFELSLTSDMAAALRPVVLELKATDDAMNKVRVDSDYLDEALVKIQGSIRHTHMTLASHLRVAQGFMEFAQAANEASLSVEQHAAVAQGLSEFFAGLGRAAKEADQLAAYALVNLFDEMGRFADRTATPARRLRLEWGNMFHSFAGFRREVGEDGKATWIFNVADGFRSVKEAVSAAGRAVVDLVVNMMRAAAATERINVAAKLSLGAGGARELDDVASIFAPTRFGGDRVRGGLMPFMRAGLKDKRLLQNIATAAADVEELSAGRVEFERALEQLGKVAVKRTVTDDALEAFGVNVNDYFGDLAKRAGVTAKRAREMAQEGKIQGDLVINTLLDAVAKQNPTGILGGASLAGGQTLGASLQRFQDLPEYLLRQADGTPAMVGLQQALDRFVDQMRGPEGASVIAALADALRAAVPAMELLAKGLTFFIGGSQEDIDRGTIGVKSNVTKSSPEQTVTSWKEGVGDVKIGGGQMGMRLDFKDVQAALARGGAEQYLQVAALMGSDDPYYADAEAKALEIVMRERGLQAGAGLAQGLQESRPIVEDATRSLAQSSTDAIMSEWEVHSPSRLFRRIGGHAGDGLVLGLKESRRRVTDATAMLLDTLAMEGGSSPSGGRGSGGGDRIAHVTIYATDGGDVVEKFEAWASGFFDRVLFREAAEAEPV